MFIIQLVIPILITINSIISSITTTYLINHYTMECFYLSYYLVVLTSTIITIVMINVRSFFFILLSFSSLFQYLMEQINYY
jgi:hypothetical protein